MRNISNNTRRSTLDIDIDFMSYPLTDEAIDNFIQAINSIKGLTITRENKIENLKHQDYKGKRIYINIKDELNYLLFIKVDIGVHKDIDIKQEEYCFDICYSEDGVSLLANTPSQMMAEKLKSLLRFGIYTTRYKDIFDIYYLIDKVNVSSFVEYNDIVIYKDSSLNLNNKNEIIERIVEIFNDETFVKKIKKSDLNWLNAEVDVVFNEIIYFITNALKF